MRSSVGFGSQAYWSNLWWGTILDLPVGLERIECPVHLAFGSNDVFGAAQTLRYAACIPRAGTSVIPFAGHAAQADAPATVTEIVRTTALRAAGGPQPARTRRKPRVARS